jgi:hypothetical protein
MSDLQLEVLDYRGAPLAVMDAYLLNDAPHLWPFTFAAHQWSCGDWGVSNIETGFGIGAGLHPTKDEAIAAAKEKLSKISIQKMRASVSKAYRMLNA